ncbi:hypothetical protein ACJA25_01715 [Mycoplasmopsis hyopharyngis]|uniref:hypothetical protein n=1 Tax=Mycoplasmopsis hyopharyngis TaxID=29558 RepID=UPI00387315A8
MKKFTLKTYNSYIDFSNEELKKRSANLIKRIKIKDVKNFEIFNFHDLASNFNEQILQYLYDFTSMIYEQKIETLIVFANDKTKNNFLSSHNFLTKNSLDSKNKIEIIFISESETSLVLNEKLQYIKTIMKKKNIGLLFSDFKKNNNDFLNFAKHLINILQINYGYYNFKKNIFIIGKEKYENQFSFLNIPEKNVLIIPNILPNDFSFFSEINLFLLLIDNVNIEEVLEGYRQGSQEWLNAKLDKNLAFQYAYIVNHLISKNEKNIIVNATNQQYLKHSLKTLSENRNLLYRGTIFSLDFYYPNDFFTYGQHLIENNSNLILTNFIVENESLDYKISDDIINDDNLKELWSVNLSTINEKSTEITNDILVNIGNNCMFKIVLEDNSNISLGIFISFIYWSFIFEKFLIEN